MHQGIRFRTSRKKSKIQFRKWNFQFYEEFTGFLDLIKPIKVRITRNSNRPDLNLTIWFYFKFLNDQLSLEEKLSPLWILEAEVENFENSNPMLVDDGVQEGKNVSLGKRCQQILSLGDELRTDNKDSKEREKFAKNQPTQGYFFSEEPGDRTPFNLPKSM